MAQWNVQNTALPAGNGQMLQFLLNDVALSYAEVVDLWRGNAVFRKRFTQAVTQTPFDACFWEVRPVSESTVDQPFECVIVDSPSLAGVSPDTGTFANYFTTGKTVVEFDNLGGDATLVVPAPLSDGCQYTHLLAFLRTAPDTQIQAFWQAVAKAVKRRIGNKPMWLSTSGLGVYWLHVRLDSVPKYYTFTPYRSPAA